MKALRNRALLASVSALAAAVSNPALAQESDNDIIVTAQRVEQRLQDVPISLSVLSQEQLTNNNVANVKDIAALTPGLQLNSRYGSDATNFSIRGFTQEQRTYSTVGTYFADVVAPRGSGATFGGDGAGPGALFDLQNVQVLKGPQGTLFGRNVTGGAVLLVPKKPTDALEGYVEGSIGRYDLRRFQGVLNVPLAEGFKARLGVDRMLRDGYLKNVGTVGDGRFAGKDQGNTDYWAFRGSVVAELTPELENYTIVSYTRSRNNGIIPKITQCIPGVVSFISRSPADAIPFGDMACEQIAGEAPHGPWSVSNRLPNAASTIEQWQVINTTTWAASDNLTIKNIASYAEFRGAINQDLYGSYFIRPGTDPATITSAGQVTGFAFTSAEPFTGNTNAQSSFVEELQFQGKSDGERLTWQAGLYLEMNNPLGWSGVQTATFTGCADITTLNCTPFTPGLSIGSINFSRSRTTFRSYAAYGQASYKLTDRLTVTGGLRYTWDKQSAVVQDSAIGAGDLRLTCRSFEADDFGSTFPASERPFRCNQRLSQDSSAPTWVIGVEHRPIDDVMVYGKWSRGYRQGGLALFSPSPTQEFDPEKVDTYEAGLKASWRGAVPGNFNISGFYNKFSDQQLLVGITSSIGAGTNAAIVNAGKSRMYGFEADLGLRPLDGLRLNLSYAYLNTKLQKFIVPEIPAPYDTVTAPATGGAIPNSQPHKLNATVNYELPLPEAIGTVSIGGTYIYTSAFRSVADTCPTATAPGCSAATLNPGAGKLPGSHVVNLNVNWEGIAGTPVDASLFVTNLTKEVYYLAAQDNSSRGWVGRLIGEPRMWGVRLRYRFGN